MKEFEKINTDKDFEKFLYSINLKNDDNQTIADIRAQIKQTLCQSYLQMKFLDSHTAIKNLFQIFFDDELKQNVLNYYIGPQIECDSDILIKYLLNLKSNLQLNKEQLPMLDKTGFEVWLKLQMKTKSFDNVNLFRRFLTSRLITDDMYKFTSACIETFKKILTSLMKFVEIIMLSKPLIRHFRLFN